MFRFYLVAALISCVDAAPFNTIYGPLTDDFTSWLNVNGYGAFQYNRPDLGSHGSYGGKIDPSERLNHAPVIFIHGNSDGALAIPGNYSSGWSYSIQYFLEQGYKSREMYVTTWGDRNPDNAKFRVHSCYYLTYMRQFVEAVIKYTEARKVNIISHSMGVTLGRKVIKGGPHYDSDGSYCYLGEPLTDNVNVFLGISGANFGMCSCQGDAATQDPTCNRINGFWPGDLCGNGNLTCWDRPQPTDCEPSEYSTFLTNLNTDMVREAEVVFSMWSVADDILANSCMVYDFPTPHITDSDCVKIFFDLSHMETKEKTVKDQYRIVTDFKSLYDSNFKPLYYCDRSRSPSIALQ